MVARGETALSSELPEQLPRGGCPEIRVEHLQLPGTVEHARNRVVLTSSDLAADPIHVMKIVESRRTRVEGFY
jgi:hypothetical protein